MAPSTARTIAPPYDPEDNRYPKALFSKDFLPKQEAYADAADGPEKDKALRAMHAHMRVVADPDDHADLDPQIWKESPADHLPEGRDPRVHRGPKPRERAAAPVVEAEPAYDPAANPFPKVLYGKDGTYEIVQSQEDYDDLMHANQEGFYALSPSDHLPSEKDPRVPKAAAKKKAGKKAEAPPAE